MESENPFWAQARAALPFMPVIDCDAHVFSKR